MDLIHFIKSEKKISFNQLLELIDFLKEKSEDSPFEKNLENYFNSILLSIDLSPRERYLNSIKLYNQCGDNDVMKEFLTKMTVHEELNNAAIDTEWTRQFLQDYIQSDNLIHSFLIPFNEKFSEIFAEGIQSREPRPYNIAYSKVT